MDINIIFDDRVNFHDKDRLIAEFDVQGIKGYSFWNAVVDLPVMVDNIAQSHKNIVFWAKEQGLKEVIIAEQDLTFTRHDSWQYFLKNKPEVYDIYSGGSYLIDNRFDYNPPLVKVSMLTGLHFYIISERYYDKFLATPKNQHIDTAQKGGDFYVCFPYPALQTPSKSANNQWQMVNYGAVLPPEFIYK